MMSTLRSGAASPQARTAEVFARGFGACFVHTISSLSRIEWCEERTSGRRRRRRRHYRPPAVLRDQRAQNSAVLAPKQAAARKAAKRRGTDLEKAAGAVLDEPVKLTALPPKEDIPSQPPPAPSPAPQEPAPAPKEATPAPAPLPPRPLHLRKQPPLTRKERHQRARIFAAWDNNACECADLGEPAPGASDFVEHSMFCPIFRCYAYEVGCCGPHYSRYAPQQSPCARSNAAV